MERKCFKCGCGAMTLVRSCVKMKTSDKQGELWVCLQCGATNLLVFQLADIVESDKQLIMEPAKR